jgi:hypothetical protein
MRPCTCTIHAYANVQLEHEDYWRRHLFRLGSLLRKCAHFGHGVLSLPLMFQHTNALTTRPHFPVQYAVIAGEANCTAEDACYVSILLE